MIKHLSLKCFRKHEDLVVNLSSGLNVLRGSNEAGKSTVLEGMLYALYGAKALRNTLTETVTWGRKESELKVEMVIQIGGVEYSFTRSKAGAECVYDGGKVTGQAEVTAFAANLLGADAKTASLLMLSSQSGLRGALDDGPTAVSSLMGRLADFDLIDRLLEAAQAKLLLGAEAPIKAKLEQAGEALQKALDEAPSDAAWRELEQQAKNYGEALVTASKQYEQAAERFTVAEKAYVEALAHNQKCEQADRDLLSTVQTHKQAESDLKAALNQARRVDSSLLQAAQDNVKAARNHAAVMSAYNLVKVLGEYPEVFWDEPRSKFDEELDRLRTKEADFIGKMQAANAEAKSIRKRFIKDGKCPTCGHDSTDYEHLKKHNGELEAEAQAQEKISQSMALQKDEVMRDIAAMMAIRQKADKFDAVRRQIEGRGYPVEIDDGFVPCRIVWLNGKPEPIDLGAAEAALRRLEAEDRAAVQAEGRVQHFTTLLDKLNKSLKAAQEAATKLKPVDMTDVTAQYNTWATAKMDLSGQIQVLTNARDQALREREIVWNRWNEAQNQIKNLRDRITEYQGDLKKLAFNNNLVKKLRTLKPAITDSLWNNILAAVGNFFSALRGEKSVVSKDASGFKVNGQSVDSLSGSTLDVLALAIRVALTKTFIPHASFLVLDEPAHGCDNGRTGNVLGFLSSVGFQQVLLASHDELSESVADNVILLES